MSEHAVTENISCEAAIYTTQICRLAVHCLSNEQ